MSSFFSETILKRGKSYFEKNRVFSVNQYDEHTYTGIVLGSEAYHTKVILDDDYSLVYATCDCPYAKEGNHCKHEAALYFSIEDRLPKEELQYLNVKEILGDIKRHNKRPFYIDLDFTNVYDTYLDKLRDFYYDGKLDITQFQRTIDELLEVPYPQGYHYALYRRTFETYEEFNSDENKEKTYTWLMEKIKYRRYSDNFNYIESIINGLNVEQQLSLYQEILKRKENRHLIRKYVKTVKRNFLDVEEYLDQIKYCKEDENYIIEKVCCYLENNSLGLARSYYKNHKQFIKSKDGKIKIKSLMQKGHEKDYYDYLFPIKVFFDEPGLKESYHKMKDFYGTRYMSEFIETMEEEWDVYKTAQTFATVRDYQQLSYYLLEKAHFRLFESFESIIKMYNFEIYTMIALECLRTFPQTRGGYKEFGRYVYRFTNLLDPMAKIEFIDLLKQDYLNNDKYINTLNEFIEGEEYKYDDDIQY